MLGLPTHSDQIFAPIQFGLNHVSVGLQLDDSWSYSCNKKHIIFSALRYLHFFSRNVINCVDDKEFEYNFNIGNTIDLLIAHASNWNRHKVEIGYNPTFVFSSSISPSLPIVPHSVNGIRNGFYLDYRYAFATKKHLGAISFGTSYSFDSIPQDVDLNELYRYGQRLGFVFRQIAMRFLIFLLLFVSPIFASHTFPFITGDNFRAIANHIFDERKSQFNPYKVQERDIVFVKTDYLKKFFMLYHHRIKHPYILLTHNSDDAIPGNYLAYLSDPKIIAWFGINATVHHPKLHVIPVGICNERYEPHRSIHYRCTAKNCAHLGTKKW